MSILKQDVNVERFFRKIDIVLPKNREIKALSTYLVFLLDQVLCVQDPLEDDFGWNS